jgi:hypothetical protein
MSLFTGELVDIACGLVTEIAERCIDVSVAGPDRGGVLRTDRQELSPPRDPTRVIMAHVRDHAGHPQNGPDPDAEAEDHERPPTAPG